MNSILVEKSIESLMSDVYNRIVNNKPYDSELKIYTFSILRKVNRFYEEKEEYEKCIIITNFIKERKNHEKNFYLFS